MATVRQDLGKATLSAPNGARWLLGLEALAQRHGLADIEPTFRLGTRGFVHPCLADGRPAVLKIGDAEELRLEAEAFRCWGSRGLSPELLHVEVPAEEPLAGHLGVLVLARAQPGTPFPELERERGRRLLASFLARFYPPLPFAPRREREALKGLGLRAFPQSVAEGLQSLGGEHELKNGVRMRQFRALAVLAEELIQSSDPQRWRLLHGDLHGHNLLLDGAELKAIDPTPYWGEPEIDLARALVGPPLLHLSEALDEGAAFLADAAGADSERVLAWARVFGALRVASESAQDPLEPARRARLLTLLNDQG